MKILAVVPARGGSKRIPGKNLRALGGRPLIAWTIEYARGIPAVCDVLVSTDDRAIADVAREAGALVPWLRPKELATDTASSVDVCLHALDWYEAEHSRVDGLLLLAPTSPFRSGDIWSRGCDLFRVHQPHPVISISPAQSHPMWCFEVSGERMRPFMEGAGLHVRSQDLPAVYVVNGAFYLIAPDALRTHRTFYTEAMVPLIVGESAATLDLDTEWDWKVAEAIVSAGLANGASRE